MAALGILMAYLFYGIIVLSGIFFAWKVFKSKRISRKILFIIGALSCFILLVFIFNSNTQYHKKASLQFVGTYNLIKYPNCDSCQAILKDDNSFVIISHKVDGESKILETGNWHFVARGDFLGVYMDKNENELLGSGRFDYDYSFDRHNRLIEAPIIGP